MYLNRYSCCNYGTVHQLSVIIRNKHHDLITLCYGLLQWITELNGNGLIPALTVGVAVLGLMFGILSWGISSMDRRLDDRMTIFHQEIDSLNLRINGIEQQLRGK